jgi:hypothetical protein
MTSPRIARLRDALLLAVAASLLLFGGGVGCDPELDGVKIRPSSIPLIPGDKKGPQDWYLAFQGKKPPGNAWLALPHPLVPPYGAEFRVGVFDDDALQESQNAFGCLGFRRDNLAEDYQICARYEITPSIGVRVSWSFDGSNAFCAGDTRVRLALADDGADVTGSYQCPGDAEMTLGTVATPYDTGERWFSYTSAYNLMKGGEVGFDDYHVDTFGALNSSNEALTAQSVFDGWRLGLQAFYDLEAQDLSSAQGNAQDGFFELLDAFEDIDDGISVFDRDTEKFLIKGGKGYLKAGSALLDGKESKYLKSYPKLSEPVACGLERMGLFY